MRRPRSRCGKKPKTHNLARALKRMQAKEERPSNADLIRSLADKDQTTAAAARQAFSNFIAPAIQQVIDNAPPFSFKIPLDMIYDTVQDTTPRP